MTVVKVTAVILLRAPPCRAGCNEAPGADSKPPPLAHVAYPNAWLGSLLRVLRGAVLAAARLPVLTQGCCRLLALHRVPGKMVLNGQPLPPEALNKGNGGQSSFYLGRKIIFTCSPYPGYT